MLVSCSKISAGNQTGNISCAYCLLKVGRQALTLGLLRGLEERPVDAPLTERDLTEDRISDKNLCETRCILGMRRLLHTFKHNILYLWLCAAVSSALRGGVGDPCSVTLSTSRLFLSGRQRPWRVSMGESTRFRGGSAEDQHQKVMPGMLM